MSCVSSLKLSRRQVLQTSCAAMGALAVPGMETPSGAQRGLPGGKAVDVPANIPHKLTITGTVERRASALALHDSREP